MRGKKRQAVRVDLTPEQRRRLENLWFYYGNYGPKTTKGNHSFIQGLLERAQDERPLKQRGYMPTAECEEAVDKILGQGEENLTASSDGAKTPEDVTKGGGPLRLVSAEQRKHLPTDPEMKVIIEETIRRRKEKEQNVSHEPDAA